MTKDIHHHFIHYLVLIIILIGGFGTLFTFRYQKDTQWTILITMALCYIAWGIGHHALVERYVHLRIVVEYILIALLGLILVRGVFGL